MNLTTKFLTPAQWERLSNFLYPNLQTRLNATESEMTRNEMLNSSIRAFNVSIVATSVLTVLTGKYIVLGSAVYFTCEIRRIVQNMQQILIDPEVKIQAADDDQFIDTLTAGAPVFNRLLHILAPKVCSVARVRGWFFRP